MDMNPSTQSNVADHRLLRLGLKANAVFSLMTGLLLAIAPSTVGDWLGVEIDGWLRLLGLALIGHFAILMFAARTADPRALGKLNLAAVAPYPLLMIGLVVFGLVDTGVGRALLLADGAVVGTVAAMQAKALGGSATRFVRTAA